MQTRALENVQFVCQDVFEFRPSCISEERKYDLVSFFLCLHDLSYPTKALTIANKILKADGKVLVLEMKCKDQFCAAATEEFSSISISVLHCLPCSRPPGGPAGEDIGNPYRMGQLQDAAHAAGFLKVELVDDQILTEFGFNVFLLSK